MKTIEQFENFNDEKFQKSYGVNKITFVTMMSKDNLHKRGSRNPKATIFCRLCIFSHKTEETLLNTILRKVHNCLVENVLLADERFHLPSKRSLMKENITVLTYSPRLKAGDSAIINQC